MVKIVNLTVNVRSLTLYVMMLADSVIVPLPDTSME